MIPSQILDNVVRVGTPAVYAYYIVHTASKFYPLALVCDDNDILVGTIDKAEMDSTNIDISRLTCGQICNRKFPFLTDSEEDIIYEKARTIFAESSAHTLPIIDKNRIPVRLFGKFQAFFKDMHKTQHFYHFATGLIEAVTLAKSRGYDRISAIEFGVGGGRGLIRLGLCAREIQRLYKIKIDVYGFDSGVGMFPPSDYRDCPQLWVEGDYKMDLDLLKGKLYDEKLVIGDICNTTKTFLAEYSPAPIGFISVDVDHYAPTVAILSMLLESDEYFLPIVTMYFDDLLDHIDFQGESLAIKEFNAKDAPVKISPEHRSVDKAWSYLANNKHDEAWLTAHILHKVSRLKWCIRYNHPKLPTPRIENRNLTHRN